MSKRIKCLILVIVLVVSLLTISVAAQADTNVASGKTITSNRTIESGTAVYCTDDLVDNNYTNGSTGGKQWVKIDFGQSYNIYKVNLWHYYADGRTYHDVIVQLSNNSNFSSGVTTIFNNDTNNSCGCGTGTDAEYAETSTGKLLTFTAVNARYLRTWINGSSVNIYNQWVEVQALVSGGATSTPTPTATPTPSGSAINVALNRPVTSNGTLDTPEYATDGMVDINYANGLNGGTQWLQMDFGVSYSINQVSLWHYYPDGRTYHDVIVQLSNDVNFTSGVTTVFNNDTNNSCGQGTGTGAEYAETSTGKTITFTTVAARYLRTWLNGSNANAYNHWIEVQAFADPGVPTPSPTPTPPPPELSIIPLPGSLVRNAGTMTLASSSRIVAADSTLQPLANVLQQEINALCGLNLSVIVSTSAQNGDIVLSYNANSGEAYTLNIDTKATVSAGNYQALALGSSSLIQLIGLSTTLPCVSIQDLPNSGYRSLMADVARRYHSISELKQLVKLCRLYKVRYLHLHFTDDQTFMFPSTAYPALDDTNNTGQPAYAIADLQGLESYAVARGVTIIPELDVPGHATKMVSQYPSVFGGSGACIDYASTTAKNACKTIIGEMLNIFTTTPYFHIGGDESGASGPNFALFLNELNTYVKSRGKTAIVWEGFGRGSGVATDIIITNWTQNAYPPDQVLADGYTNINASWIPLYVVQHYSSTTDITAYPPSQIYTFSKYLFGNEGTASYPTGAISVSPSSNVLGAEMCWWEGVGSYAIQYLRQRVAPMCAKVWNLSGETNFSDFNARFQSTDSVLTRLLTIN
jgi:hypothetical protein